MAKKLSSLSKSGKAVYSDSALMVTTLTVRSVSSRDSVAAVLLDSNRTNLPVSRKGASVDPTSAKIRKSHASAREAGSTTVRHRVARGREGQH